MLARFQTAIELLYPPRCLGCGALVDSDFGLCGPCWRETPFVAGTVCDLCGVPLQGAPDGHQLQCDDCMKMPRPWTKGRAALIYKDKARQLVLALKHGDRPEIARPAAAWMGLAGRSVLQPGGLIVPVPLHWSRLVRRRYNQSALIARALARQTGLDHCPDALIRRTRTTPQDGKSAAQRFEELDGAIVVHPRRQPLIASRNIVIVDDVVTSGATLAACTQACHAAGAGDVFVLTLARVSKED